MNLVVSEVKKKTGLFKIFSFLNLFSLIIGTYLLYYSYFDFLIYLITFYILFIIFSIPINFIKFSKKNYDLNYKSIISLNLKTIAFYLLFLS